MNVQLQYQEETPSHGSASATKKCTICESEGKYKCPTCLVYYDSSKCDPMKLQLQIEDQPTFVSAKKCTICESRGQFKCPLCSVYYCSLVCCKKHRERKCKVTIMEKPLPEFPPHLQNVEYLTDNTVPEERLQLLENDQMLKDLLDNPHLRNLLRVVDESKNPEETMQKAMQEPLFVEFADACLKVVEPEDEKSSDRLANT